MSVACSPDGRWIVSGDYAKTVTIWEASSRSKLGAMQCSGYVRLPESRGGVVGVRRGWGAAGWGGRGGEAEGAGVGR